MKETVRFAMGALMMVAMEVLRTAEGTKWGG